MKPILRLDDLRWLLGSLTLVLAPVLSHLALWVPAVALLFGFWRYYIASRGHALPRLFVLLPLTLACSAGILASYGGLFGRDASIALLSLMIALKLLEAHSRRDLVLLVFLAYFISLTGFLFSQSLLVGVYLLLPVTALTATLIGLHHPNGMLSAGFRLRLAALMLGQAAPVMLAMFLLFPRVSGPLWGVPQDAYRGMTGLSDDMSPGSISHLSQSDAVAFRAEFTGNIPSQPQLYWRGPVFWHFDGITWRIGAQAAALPREKSDGEQQPVGYSVTLEPHNRHWLFMLDLPAKAPPNGVLSHDYQLLARQPVRTRIRYDAVSHLQYRLQAELAPQERHFALQMPRYSNPQARALGARWAAESRNAEEIVQRALTMFREENFVYTLTPPLMGGHNVDQFLFSVRRGFCEHYAGSFVFLMRAAGVPARVVTGYQGGEVNPVGNYLIVRQTDAHAWAEVWLQGRGWVRVDPTAAVSPLRVESGMASALPAGEPVPALIRGDYPLLRKLYLNWDAINNGWNQWVLGYNQQRQMELLSRLTSNRVSWQDLVIGLMLSVATIVLAISWLLLRRSRQPLSALQKSWRKFQRKLARAGIHPLPYEGPLDYGQRAARALPHQSAAILEISQRYAQLRYGMQTSADLLAALQSHIKEFRN